MDTGLDWENLKTLQALAEEKTVRGAAKKLSVHHATISRRIEQLEATLGARLFDRQPDGLVMTKAAEELASLSQDFSEQVLASRRRIEGKDSQLSGQVILTVVSPMAETLLAPYFPDFADRYPQLDLTISSTYEVLDLSRRQADIAVRFTNDPLPSLVGKRICEVHFSTYASVDYVKTHDLKGAPESARMVGWAGSSKAVEAYVETTPFRNTPTWGSFDDLGLHIACVKAGLGIAALPCISGDREPDLVRVGDQTSHPTMNLWLLTHNDLRHTARIRVVMDFVEEILRKKKRAFEGELPELLKEQAATE